ncbi:hypothetical protein AVP41_00361 [Microbacterium sp. TNHR37B]|nr:hypothetical protein AVP41_00361 [Microbacterium sp. TNHR37B]
MTPCGVAVPARPDVSGIAGMMVFTPVRARLLEHR